MASKLAKPGTPEYQANSDAAHGVETILAQMRESLDDFHQARQYGQSQPRAMIASKFKHAASGANAWNPFPTFGHFLSSVQKAATAGWQQDGKMRAYVEGAYKNLFPGSAYKATPSGMNEVVGADGGFLVAPEWLNQVLMRTYGDSDLLGRTTMIPLSSGNTLKVPGVNETSRANGSRFGGVTAYWRAEAASVDFSKINLEEVSLELKSLMVLMRATEEVLEDSNVVALESLANLIIPQELAFKLGDAIVNGTGVGQPMGILQSPSKVTQAKEAGQPGGSIVAANVLNMWSRLHASCRPNAVWLIDQTCEPKLYQMTIGAAGSNLAVFLPPGGLSSSPYATLMGKPVLPVEFCPVVGTEGDITLTDLSTYLSISKGGVQSASSMHVYFSTNEMAFRFIYRMDGRSWWLTALTPKSTGPTQSNIVTLETRA